MGKWLLLMLVWLLFVHGGWAEEKSEEKGPKEGEEAPTFYRQTLDGKDFFLRDWCGKELRQPWLNKEKYVIVLSFFATWCVPCQREIPELEKLSEKYRGKNVKFYLIDIQEGKRKVKRFVKAKGYKFPVLMDRYGAVKELYGAATLPRLFVIDKQGIIRLINKGFGENAEEILKKIEDTIDATLAEPDQPPADPGGEKSPTIPPEER
ncbi:redoxin domain-containing protein [candidate division KSB1 bacterium]|nr:redoxin domain-containing protein [candidate division KSB1 bacterium]